jgi:hypothetical protein
LLLLAFTSFYKLYKKVNNLLLTFTNFYQVLSTLTNI